MVKRRTGPCMHPFRKKQSVTEVSSLDGKVTCDSQAQCSLALFSEDKVGNALGITGHKIIA